MPVTSTRITILQVIALELGKCSRHEIGEIPLVNFSETSRSDLEVNVSRVACRELTRCPECHGHGNNSSGSLQLKDFTLSLWQDAPMPQCQLSKITPNSQGSGWLLLQEHGHILVHLLRPELQRGHCCFYGPLTHKNDADAPREWQNRPPSRCRLAQKSATSDWSGNSHPPHSLGHKGTLHSSPCAKDDSNAWRANQVAVLACSQRDPASSRGA